LVFYEKPGCGGNARQKWLLRQEGIAFDARNLLNTPWTAEELRAFFADKAVADWFNPTAPLVKEGWIDVQVLGEQQALQLMLDAPILIRRPLLQWGDLRQSGFEAGPVLSALGVTLDPDEDLQACPRVDAAEQPAPGCGLPQ
ncbi:MAG: nitrogenase-associated protein, partial [Gammaproteobacteria bacterium]|nr:nitrogenase-associated protein [Gammaproteobacteria bacterium]